jgi:hypothetical protein
MALQKLSTALAPTPVFDQGVKYLAVQRAIAQAVPSARLTAIRPVT